jgi:hypothetical protein
MLACESPTFMRRALLALGAYGATAVAIGAAFIFKVVPGPLTVPAALLPIIPAAFLPFSLLEKLRAMDELQRRIQFEAMAFAFAATAVISLSIGFLQGFAQVPEINWVWVWPLLGCCQIVGIVLGKRRYR